MTGVIICEAHGSHGSHTDPSAQPRASARGSSITGALVIIAGHIDIYAGWKFAVASVAGLLVRSEALLPRAPSLGWATLPKERNAS